MANTDLRSGSTQLPAINLKQAFSVVKNVDFSVNGGGAADTFNVLNLPAGSLAAFIVSVETVEGGAATIDMVTTESTPQTILDDASINALANLKGDGADGDAALVWFYVTEDCIVNIVTNTAATGAAELNVRAFVLGAGLELS